MPPDDMPPQAAQIDLLRADLARRYEELAAMQRMVLALEADLAAAQARAQTAESRLNEIRNSLPWRIARPLRAVWRRLRR